MTVSQSAFDTELGELAGARTERYLLGVPSSEITRPDRIVFAIPLAAAILGFVTGAALVVSDDADALAGPILGLMAVALGIAFGRVWRTTGSIDRGALLWFAVATASAVGLLLLPKWIYGWGIHAIISRTAISGPLVLVISAAVYGRSIKSLLAGAPAAGDYALIAWLVLPIAAAGAAYAVLIGKIVTSGLGGLQLNLLLTSWNALPPAQGFLNSILGTFLLMTLALALAFLPAIGVGVFVAQYPGRMATLIDLSAQMLRAVPLFVLGGAAWRLVSGMNGMDATSPLSVLVRGVFTDPVSGATEADKGSFLLAAVFVALVILPIVAKMTEEGLRSVPREMTEASVALGAREGYSLRRILLPWAAPNILTGVLLAAAEANGCLALIMFIAGPGQGGIGPFHGVTTLEWAVFGTYYGPRQYSDPNPLTQPASMVEYQYTAALLLLILTLGLTLGAMFLQRQFGKRYRGSITAS